MLKTKPKRRPGRPTVAEITPAQKRTLKLIADSARDRGYPPTMQELADELGITSASVYDQIVQLERKGYLKREAGKARSLVVLRTETEPLVGLVRLPLVGMVAAGQPILAEENILGEVLVYDTVARSGACFGLRLQGDSMKGIGIYDGDHLIVRQQPLAAHGDIVVANVDGETTVKRLYHVGDTIELRPENKKYKPIPIALQADFKIIGKVIAIQQGERNTKPITKPKTKKAK
jgi:repressor LexA